MKKRNAIGISTPRLDDLAITGSDAFIKFASDQMQNQFDAEAPGGDESI